MSLFLIIFANFTQFFFDPIIMIALLGMISFLFFVASQSEVDLRTLNSHFQATKKFCIQDLHTNPSIAYFQHRLTRIVYRSSDGTTVNVINLPLTTFKKMQCIGSRKLSLLGPNNFITLYDTIDDLSDSFEGVEVTDVTFVKESQKVEKIVYISNFQSLHVKRVPFDSKEEVYKLNGTFSEILCSVNRNKSLDGYCFTFSQNRTVIQYFNTQSPERVQQKEMPGFHVVKISEMAERIYFGFQSGLIKEYSLKQGLLFFQRSTKISLDSPIIDLAINELRNQLIYLNANLKTGIISLNTGLQMGSSLACQNICNNSSKIILFAPNQFAFFTPSFFQTIRPFFNNQAIVESTSESSVYPLKALCLSKELYFNLTFQQCKLCQIGCSVCDQETSFCFSCTSGYFMKDTICTTCKYTTLDEEDYELCFDEKQISILILSNKVAPVIVSGIQSTYSILSGSALLFLFIRFINFWSLVSIYYFLSIEAMPYFLQQFLSKIFTILYGSVFEYFGIGITWINMGIEERETNQKMKFTKISTDFVGSNFQSILTFIYSAILICVLYDSIKNWFLRFNIHVFEKVKLEACLQEFMGIFIPLVVPLSFFLTNLCATNTLNQINNALFILFLGIGSIFPFIYVTLIVQRITLKQRLAMIKEEIHENLFKSQKMIQSALQTTHGQQQCQQNIEEKNKVQKKNNESKPCRRRAFRIKQTATLNVTKLIKKPLDFATQSQMQKFLYCFNAFWSPFLVGFANPAYFLSFGVFINFICVINAFYANHCRANIIFEKLILFAYHLCFVVMALSPQHSFTLSLIAVALIICGGVHQLITAISQKVYFIYLILKNKKVLRDNRIVQQKLSKSQKNIISIFEVTSKLQKDQASSLSEDKLSIQQPTLKQIIECKTLPNLGTKTIIKKTKFIQGNHPLYLHTNKKIQNVLYFHNLTSIQSIKLESQNTQPFKDCKKVIFDDIVNSKQPLTTQLSNQKYQKQIQKQKLSQQNSTNVEEISKNKFYKEGIIENPLLKFNPRDSSEKSKENYRTELEFQRNFSKINVSKSFVDFKRKIIKQPRFLKVILTQTLKKKK